ncbi:MAG: MaoC family dehydratase N-terminal domain-containing protein [Halioglobus sp.]
MSSSEHVTSPPAFNTLVGERTGPYCSFNPVSRVQVWQWCSAMGDHNPLYLDEAWRKRAGFDRVVAPPAMMQMWTMRDINCEYAPGTVVPLAPRVFDVLGERGFGAIVAVSYDINFQRLLLEGDRAHHYSTITSISPLKQTVLGQGYFVVERAEYLDQEESPFAEALITYFVYQPESAQGTVTASEPRSPSAAPAMAPAESHWRPDFTDVDYASLHEGQALPELVIPITHKLIVGGALATQDFMDVHHNAPAARAAGMPDIFMNILTTSGLCARYLSDWAGPGSRLRHIRFKLMAPNLPGDTMVMQGHVAQLERDKEPRATVEFAGRNSRGFHVTGSATLALMG